MLKKLWEKFMNVFWKKQNKKLNKLQKTVDRLENQLEEQKKQTNQLKNYIKDQLERRDAWEMRSAEIKYLAGDKKIWVIKCPATDSPTKYLWGPHNFSVDLKRELEKRGYYVVIDYRDDWAGMIEADYVLVLRGVHPYRPDRRAKNCKYILWHNCFPYRVTDEEYELYDLILVNSYTYTKKVAERVSVPVKPMLLCADVEKFFPQETELKYDKVFVGNARSELRNVVTWCDEKEIPLHLWGRVKGPNSWHNFLKENTKVVVEGPMENTALPELYRSSKIILNDHYTDMKEEGFINNRILEALSCGRPVLSDYSEEFEKLFGDSLVYYHDEEDFLEKLKWLDEHSEEQKEKVLAIWPKLQEEYSFAARAKELDEIVKELD